MFSDPSEPKFDEAMSSVAEAVLPSIHASLVNIFEELSKSGDPFKIKRLLLLYALYELNPNIFEGVKEDLKSIQTPKYAALFKLVIAHMRTRRFSTAMNSEVSFSHETIMEYHAIKMTRTLSECLDLSSSLLDDKYTYLKEIVGTYLQNSNGKNGVDILENPDIMLALDWIFILPQIDTYISNLQHFYVEYLLLKYHLKIPDYDPLLARIRET